MKSKLKINKESNESTCKTAIGRRLFFYNDSQRQPKLNQRVLLYLSNQKENSLSQLKYTTAVYQHDAKKGKDVYVLDAGGCMCGVDVIWSELPFVEPEQIDKILGVLPF